MIIKWPKHIRLRCPGDKERCRDDRCMTCALFACATCGAAEGELATECPGYRLSPEERAAVMNGHLDFRSGAWACMSVESRKTADELAYLAWWEREMAAAMCLEQASSIAYFFDNATEPSET
jgi:hypothetical protein